MSGGFPEIVVSRFNDNSRIGMRVVDRDDQAPYGPAQAQVFDEMGEGADSALAETSWVVEDPTAEPDALPIDLVLASLLGDLDDDDEA